MLDVQALVEEPHRQLMAQYLLYRLGSGSAPEAQLIRSGLAYWEACVERFSHTRYSADLAQDVQNMRGRLE